MQWVPASERGTYSFVKEPLTLTLGSGGGCGRGVCYLLGPVGAVSFSESPLHVEWTYEYDAILRKLRASDGRRSLPESIIFAIIDRTTTRAAPEVFDGGEY